MFEISNKTKGLLKIPLMFLSDTVALSWLQFEMSDKLRTSATHINIILWKEKVLQLPLGSKYVKML